SCENLKEAREQIFLTNPSLILLDINLPDGNGLDLVKEIRDKNLSFPIILLSANDTDADVVKGLELGADDYVTKPFSLAVLRARVNTQLRKKETVSDEDVITIGSYSFDFERMKFTVDGVETSLSKTEQRLLKMFVCNQGITLSRDDLIDRLWTDGAEYVDENALSVAIKRLRDKLHAKDYIKTIYGLGYMWVNDNE
ncbi:MAG: response regulator transcription factor, partial [Treponema sp.]|nr:response regulator transcription factor [Treponema sp.]